MSDETAHRPQARPTLSLRSTLRSVRRSRIGITAFGPIVGQQWLRVVMDRAIGEFLASLDVPSCDALEISGNAHQALPWKSYRQAWYPELDLLDPKPLGTFDVVLCEQVLEHVGGDPWVVFRSLAGLCRPGGHLVVSTPFMVRIHGEDSDFWRFTPQGMVLMASAAGLEVVTSGSWGNLWCIRANRAAGGWAVYRPWHRALRRFSLANDALNPQQVWAVCRKPISA